jgi:hypothetical protein
VVVFALADGTFGEYAGAVESERRCVDASTRVKYAEQSSRSRVPHTRRPVPTRGRETGSITTETHDGARTRLAGCRLLLFRRHEWVLCSASGARSRS